MNGWLSSFIRESVEGLIRKNRHVDPRVCGIVVTVLFELSFSNIIYKATKYMLTLTTGTVKQGMPVLRR